VKSWLAYNSNQWLLIIDNADDPEIDYSRYVPHGNSGHILLTTRNPECVVHNTVGKEHLKALEPDLAEYLLLRASGIEQSRWTEKKGAASAIVDILGSHTLAIVQAGAFIKQRLCTIKQYPVIFQQEKGQLLKFHSRQNMSIYRNVYTTFEVSAKYLERSDLQEVSDTLDLPHTLAFMHNSSIPESLFQRAAEYVPQVKDMDLQHSPQHITRLPEYVSSRNNLQNQLRLRKACSVLESLSTVTTKTNDDGSLSISAHSLVQAWAKERQDPQSQTKAWQAASTIMVFSCQEDYTYCPFLILLQPHIRACVDHDIESYTQQMSEVETAQILFHLAYVLLIMRDDDSLKLLTEHIRSRLRNRATANREIMSCVAFFTGRVYKIHGEYGKAVRIYEDLVENQTQALAKDHHLLLASRHELAFAYLANGRFQETLKLLEYLVRIQKKVSQGSSQPACLAA